MNYILPKRIEAEVSLQQSMLNWETDISDNKNFVRITENNRATFFSFLGLEIEEDSYATSPAYYALTGRKGLWVYKDGSSYVPLCWHPNTEGEVLVFPVRGEKKQTVLKKMLTEMPVPPNGIRLGRMKQGELDDVLGNNIYLSKDRKITFAPVQENVLDWLFPVRVLSTKTVTLLQGRKFSKERNYINQLNRRNTRIERLSVQHIPKFLELAARWAANRASAVDQLSDLTAPYVRVAELVEDRAFHIDGMLVFVNDQLEGVGMWEIPNPQCKVANALVNLATTKYKGVSEYIMNAASRKLWENGITHINYGGSETQGLDQYKVKFDPAYSVHLSSVLAVVENRNNIKRPGVVDWMAIA